MPNDLYQNKYKPHSIRMNKYDYGRDGLYFITICTNYRKCLLGKIENNKMILSKAGELINKCWQEIPEHFLGIYLDAYIIMPNHIHGIIEINSNYEEYKKTGKVNLEEYGKYLWGDKKRMVETQQCCVSTDVNSANDIKQKSNTFYRLKSKSLPVIIRSFKSICTREINKKYFDFNFKWQSSYFEHVIKNEKSLDEIRYYIKNNPWLWQRDRNNPVNFST